MIRPQKLYSLFFFALVAACGSSRTSPQKSLPLKPTDVTSASAASSVASTSAPPMDAGADASPMNDVVSDFAPAIAGFNADLYAQLKTHRGNIFYSPASIELALAMTAAGARGDTAHQMQKVLHLSADAASSNAGAAHLLASWSTADDNGSTLIVANRLWGQRGSAFLPDYLQTTRDSYGAELAQVDYKTAPEDARIAINAWVSNKTNQKIVNLLGPSALTKATRLVVTNAVYFKGAWRTRFEKSATKNAAFKTATASVNATAMHHTFTSASYAESTHAQLLALPYKGDGLSMLIALPKTGATLAMLESDLNGDAMMEWARSLTEYKVEVSLPRFKTTAQFELGPTLQQMGMPLAFTDQADFSGIVQGPGEPLSISNVIHKAFVEVNEDGTEAAAATGVVMTTRAMRAPVRSVVFNVDHPFLFFIRDDKSGAILFAGRIEDPTK